MSQLQMHSPANPAGRLPTEVLAEWRRLERLLDSGLVQDGDVEQVTGRIEELKAEYRTATDSVRDASEGLLARYSPELNLESRS